MMKNLRLMRNGAAMIALLGFAALGNPAAAFAQEASASSAIPATQAQVPDGSWFYTVTIPGYTFQGIETYSVGGGYVEADQLSFSPLSVASAGHGVWRATASGTFLLTYVNLTFDSFSDGAPTGTLKVRQTTTIAATGNTYSGSGDYTYYDLNGNPIPSISGTFTITAKRIPLEAPAKQ